MNILFCDINTHDSRLPILAYLRLVLWRNRSQGFLIICLNLVRENCHFLLLLALSGKAPRPTSMHLVPLLPFEGGALFLAVEAPFSIDIASISRWKKEGYCCLYLHRGSRWLDLPQLINPEPVAVQQLSCQRDKLFLVGKLMATYGPKSAFISLFKVTN